jgi:hypothetical protein
MIYKFSDLVIVNRQSDDEKKHVFIRFKKDMGPAMWIGYNGLYSLSPFDAHIIGVDMI